MFSIEDFRALWASLRELAVIETLDDKGKPQGFALVHMDQMYQAAADGGFAKVSYLACSDEYYQWWVDNELGPNFFHHFCRHETLKGCMAKTGREGVVHVMQWTPITRPEAETILREWGYSPILLGKAPRALPGGSPDDDDDDEEDRPEVRGSATPKVGTPRPPPGLGQGRAPVLKNRRTQAGRERAEDQEVEHLPRDRRSKKTSMARPVSPPGEPPQKARRPQDSGQAALDKMLDEDPYDADSDKLRGDAHERLASLREDLQRRKASMSRANPGTILATRAAAVAETAGKKRKNQGDKVLNALTKVLKKKNVKEEVDYGEEPDQSDSSEGSDTDEEETRLLSGSMGSSSTAAKQRKLRNLSERKPGKLLQTGYNTMHEQVGTYFGHDDSKKDVLTPVALRYLLSYALPQFRNGVSHDKYRELRTLATCLDHLFSGQTGQAGDLLLQRYKALLMTLRDGSDAASRYIELLPEEEMPTMASSQESFLARSLAVHHAKSDELLRRAST